MTDQIYLNFRLSCRLISYLHKNVKDLYFHCFYLCHDYLSLWCFCLSVYVSICWNATGQIVKNISMRLMDMNIFFFFWICPNVRFNNIVFVAVGHIYQTYDGMSTGYKKRLIKTSINNNFIAFIMNIQPPPPQCTAFALCTLFLLDPINLGRVRVSVCHHVSLFVCVQVYVRACMFFRVACSISDLSC